MDELRQELGMFSSVDIRDENALSNLMSVGQRHSLKTSELVDEWVSFTTNSKEKNCSLDDVTLERFNSQLQVRRLKQTTPTSRRTVSRILEERDINDIFSDNNDIDGENDDLMNVYTGVTPTRTTKGTKRTMKSPVTPVSKVTPSVPKTPTALLLDDSNGYLAETPAGKYSTRNNSGDVICVYNNYNSITIGHSDQRKPSITLYGNSPLTTTPRHMYQKNLERTTVLQDRVENFGELLCKRNGIKIEDESNPDEPFVYIGIIVCDGEGRLNEHSCLLEGVHTVHEGKVMSSVQLILMDNLHSCSLFPGQIVAVEGELQVSSNALHVTRIYDEGCLALSPDRGRLQSVGGFTMMVAAGPFTTSDNLDMLPLHDLLKKVSIECPTVLLLMGPFLDATHSMVKDWAMTESYEHFLSHNIFVPIIKTCRKTNTRVVVVPSHKDIAHQSTIYPQPPFCLDKDTMKSFIESDVITFVSDPSLLLINGVHVGVTSTDVLFHMNSLSLFIGPNPDRMSRLASHIIHQQSFYPVYPPYCHNSDTLSDHTPYNDSNTPDINLDLLLAYDAGHAFLPIVPDILILTSVLKPFVKNVDNCLCINTGRLTKKSSGGTYSNIVVKESSVMDLPTHTGIQIAYV